MKLIRPSFEILTCPDGEDVLRQIEAAGRTCYKSEAKITPDSAKAFVKRILDGGHHSVIEHVSMSVRIICDRGVTHEIVRHRLCSFSQESTRYCDYSGKVTFIIPPWVKVEEGDYDEKRVLHGRTVLEYTEAVWLQQMLQAELCYTRLRTQGWSAQEARSVLPNSTKTEIVWTANMREWMHIFTLRCSKAAHPQMREVMLPLLAEMQKRLPILFQNLPH